MPTRQPYSLRLARQAFTLVEALVSTSIATIAGTALLLGISSSIQTTDAVLDQALAEGLAEQLMDEIAGCRFVEPGNNPLTTPLGPDAGEANGNRRDLFDDIDDYAGLVASPPCDHWGIPLGEENGSGGRRHVNFFAPSSRFAGWEQRVEVNFANPVSPASPLSAGQTSHCKIVRVSIIATDANNHRRKLTELARVFNHVPR